LITRLCLSLKVDFFVQYQEARATALEQLTAAKGRLAILQKELGEYGACDPAKVDEIRRGVVLAKDAAFRWTGEAITHGNMQKS
jgi:hypothetical protein